MYTRSSAAPRRCWSTHPCIRPVMVMKKNDDNTSNNSNNSSNSKNTSNSNNDINSSNSHNSNNSDNTCTRRTDII